MPEAVFPLMSIAPLTLILGVERSGTTVLLRSLARDKRLSSFSEGEGALYSGLYLRRETEVRPFLEQRPGPILTKPLSETTIRPVTDVLDEFAAYDPRLIWIYRDPVNVYHSWVVQGWTRESLLPFFLHQWNGRNRRLLSALATHGGRITLVRYEDLLLDSAVWRKTCERVSIKGESLFRPDSRAGRAEVSKPIQDVIDAETAGVWEALENARTFRSGISRRLLSGHGLALIRDDRRRRVLGRLARAEDTKREICGIAKGGALMPAEVAGLCLWLDAGLMPDLPGGFDCDGVALPDRLGCGLCRRANGRTSAHLGGSRPTLGILPPGSADDPDAARGGFVCAMGDDWRFLFDGSEWTVMAAYRPLAQRGLFGAQALLQVGNGSDGEFVFGVTAWGADVAAISSPRPSSEGQTAAVPIVMASPLRAPAEPEVWRVATMVHHRVGTPPFGGMAISGYRGQELQGTGTADQNLGYPQGAASTQLHLGYTPGRTAGAFSGDLAELIVFRGALDERCRRGVVQYLAEKYPQALVGGLG